MVFTELAGNEESTLPRLCQRLPIHQSGVRKATVRAANTPQCLSYNSDNWEKGTASGPEPVGPIPRRGSVGILKAKPRWPETFTADRLFICKSQVPKDPREWNLWRQRFRPWILCKSQFLHRSGTLGVNAEQRQGGISDCSMVRWNILVQLH